MTIKFIYSEKATKILSSLLNPTKKTLIFFKTSFFLKSNLWQNEFQIILAPTRNSISLTKSVMYSIPKKCQSFVRSFKGGEKISHVDFFFMSYFSGIWNFRFEEANELRNIKEKPFLKSYFRPKNYSYIYLPTCTVDFSSTQGYNSTLFLSTLILDQNREQSLL